MTKGKQHLGRIDIARARDNTGRDFIQMRLEDEESGCAVFDVELSIENFGNAITGLGDIPCEFRVLGVERVGKRAEHKTVEVFLGDGTRSNEDSRIRDAVAKHEANGWRGRDADLKNRHKFVRRQEGTGGAWYDVDYTRFVDIEGDE